MISWLSLWRNLFTDFVKWWVSELAGLLPASLRKANTRSDVEHVVVVGTGGLRLIKSDFSGTSQWCAEHCPVLSPKDILEQVTASARGRIANGRVTAGIRVPFSFCFSRTVELPLSASDDFSRLLLLDLERATPFRAKDVYTAVQVMPKKTASAASVPVRQLIIKRQMLDPSKSALEAAGLPVGRIECWDENGSQAIPAEFGDGEAVKGNETPGALRSILALLFLAVVLGSTASYIYLSRMDDALAKLDIQARTLKDQIAGRRDGEAQVRAIQGMLSSLSLLSKSTISKLDVVDELTRRLPDSAWVSDVRIGTDSADFTGFATSAVSLLPVLEKSRLFVDATSTAAVTFDPREDKERFGIHVKFRRSVGATGPAEAPP